ncbi:MAG TPA: Fe-S cluster assembly protein SufB [Erysipelothrix sp.]|nr:Fe-S cluster assembly protein SufB [Erysipelothrix sp.]
MSKEKISDLERLPSEDYAFGFSDTLKPVIEFEKGLNEAVVRKLSKLKNEPQWMLEKRLEAYHHFVKREMPRWGADLDDLDFDEFIYYSKASENMETTWDEVPEKIRNTFDRLGIPEAEAKFLSGVATQYDSEVVYHSMLKEATDKGVLFFDLDTGLEKYPEIVKKYFGTLIPYDDNKFSALNTAVWSGGSFIYVPKGVKLDKPLQSYFRINAESMGQFERTLIIVDEGADVHYVEGCTAPLYSKHALHAAVVEIFVHENAKCRYTTIQNWSDNVYNLVTQRALVEAHGQMEWIDGNIGSYKTMKYPATILKGDYAKGMTISVAVGSQNQAQDTGAKMFHEGNYTESNIVSKSVSRGGGRVDYRGIVKHGENAKNAKSKIECDTLILDPLSRSDTMPLNIMQNATSTIEHEAAVSKISEDELFYLMSRGLSEEQAKETIVMGFLEPFTRELPMEYAIELNQLMKMEMEGSVG